MWTILGASSDNCQELDFSAMDAARQWRMHAFCERHMPGPLMAAGMIPQQGWERPSGQPDAGMEPQQDEDMDNARPGEHADADDSSRDSSSDHSGI